jgi:toxin ParE1/3/4
MASYTLTGAAAADINQIVKDSIARWGRLRGEKYFRALCDSFQRLAEFSDIGSDAGDIRPGYMKMRSGGHVAFYRKTDDGIVIVRVLHERMDFEQHL